MCALSLQSVFLLVEFVLPGNENKEDCEVHFKPEAVVLVVPAAAAALHQGWYLKRRVLQEWVAVAEFLAAELSAPVLGRAVLRVAYRQLELRFAGRNGF